MAILPASIQIPIGSFIGIPISKIIKKRFRISKINISMTNQPKGTLKKHWKSLGISLFETANALFASSEKIEKSLIVNNRALIDNLISSESNIMLLVPHTTHMLLAGRALLTVFKTHNIYRPQTNKIFNHFLTTAYTNNGSTLIDANNPREIIRSMKSGTPVWYAPDNDIYSKSVFAPFFGVPTSTLVATQKLAKISNATIVPLSFIRKGNRYVLSFGNGFNLKDLSEFDAATKVNQELEKLINLAPEQYYWVHRRFKTNPDKLDIYK
jgi:lauroyl/myristoyl acyltransferase